MINAIVLAGGESKRMGRPKALLRFAGETFLEHIVSVLKDCPVDVIMVVLGADAETIKEHVDLSGVDVVINKRYKDGQLSSLIAGIENVPRETEGILICLVDMPFITEKVVSRIVAEFKATHRPIVQPVFGGKRGHPVLFSKLLFDELRNAPADQGARYVIHSNEDKVIEVQAPDDGILISINTLEDYKLHFGANL
jgi:molybdenum cofactor cytidylyltransferase